MKSKSLIKKLSSAVVAAALSLTMVPSVAFATAGVAIEDAVETVVAATEAATETDTDSDVETDADADVVSNESDSTDATETTTETVAETTTPVVSEKPAEKVAKAKEVAATIEQKQDTASDVKEMQLMALTDVAPATVEGSFIENEVIVTYDDKAIEKTETVEVAAKQTEVTLEDLGVEEQEVVVAEAKNPTGGDVTVAKLDDTVTVQEAIARLENIDGVQAVQPNYRYELSSTGEGDSGSNPTPPPAQAATNDTHLASQYYLDNTGVKTAWNSDKIGTSRAVTVAVLDSGCDLNHEDLQDALAKYKDIAWDVQNGKALKDSGITNFDSEANSHGTGVCGVIAASFNNSMGIAGVSKTTVNLLPIRVFTVENNKTTITTGSVVSGLNKLYEYALAGKFNDSALKVVNMSFGSPLGQGQGDDNAVKGAIQKIQRRYNTSFICAGGNGDDNQQARSVRIIPSDYEECIGVTSVNSNNTPSTFSDYNQYKDISAPGEGIVTTTKNNGYSINNGSGTLNGSSFSAPIVSGIAALMYSAVPTATPEQIRTSMRNTATRISQSGNGSAGVIQANAAIVDLLGTLGKPSITATVANDEKTVHIKATGGLYAASSSVKFPTWSAKGGNNGQDDLIWYDGKWNSDISAWEADVDISRHKTSGVYYVHGYGVTSGSQRYISNASFEISAPTATVTINTDKANAGFFKMDIKLGKNVFADAVMLPTWFDVNGQDDIVWFNAEYGYKDENGKFVDDGLWHVRSNISLHKFQTGKFYAHAYVRLSNGIFDFAGGAQGTLTVPAVSMDTTISTDKKSYDIVGKGGLFPLANSVNFATWTAANGQDDLVWYPGQSTASEGVKGKVDLSRHREAGTYIVHAYGNVEGKQTFLGATEFTIANPVATVNATPNANGSIQISVSVTSSVSPAVDVKVPTWFDEGGQDDIQWINTTKSGNTWTGTTTIANHKYQTGKFYCHAYVTMENGIFAYAGESGDKTLTLGDATLTATEANDGSSFTLTGSGGYFALATEVKFPTWSEANGQDDLVWYTGTKNSSTGAWSTTVPISSHRTAGQYAAHAYAVVGNELKFAKDANFEVGKANATDAVTTNADNKTGEIVVTATLTGGKSAVDKVQIPLWFDTNGQDDIRWLDAQRTTTTGNVWKATTNVKDHKMYTGKFNAHVYVTHANGVFAYAGAPATQPEFTFAASLVSVTKSSDDKELTITGQNGIFGMAEKVYFPTWTKDGGQDDVVWHEATKQSNGSWVAKISTSSHKANATHFNIHAYVEVSGGLHFAGAENEKALSSMAATPAATPAS